LTALEKRLGSGPLALALRECQQPSAGRARNGVHQGSTEVSTMKVRPLADRVVIKRLESEEKTKGGIIIPDSAKEKPIEGRVVAVGNGKVQKNGKVRPLEVKEGDRVLIGKYAGTEVKVDGVEHVILSEDEILAVLGS
jgi:chaperonin GroES